MTATPLVIRTMQPSDLPRVAEMTNISFAALRGGDAAQAMANPTFPDLLFESRLAASPARCFVAEAGEDPTDGEIVGAVFSVTHGSLGWFGPLAVAPAAQGAGVGQLLVLSCLESWEGDDVRLMGLETFADSPFHVHLYTKLGFRPSWTGVAYAKPLGETSMPAGIEVGSTSLPDLSFVLKGLDVSDYARATISSGAGTVLTADGGVAVCHFQSTFQEPGTGFVAFLAAETRGSFETLMDAAEHLSREAGCTSILTRVPGSAIQTIEALRGREYRAGGAMIRMKSGEDLDYDGADAYYCDNWL